MRFGLSKYRDFFVKYLVKARKEESDAGMSLLEIFAFLKERSRNPKVNAVANKVSMAIKKCNELHDAINAAGSAINALDDSDLD